MEPAIPKPVEQPVVPKPMEQSFVPETEPVVTAHGETTDISCNEPTAFESLPLYHHNGAEPVVPPTQLSPLDGPNPCHE